MIKEIDALLIGRLTNDDEDEVEDELERLEAEERVARGEEVVFPNVPTTEEWKTKRARERAEERRQRQTEEAQSPPREMVPA